LITSSSLPRAKETADIIYNHQVAHCNNATATTKSTTSTMSLISDDSKLMNYTTTKNVAPPLRGRIIDIGFNEMSSGEFEGLSYSSWNMEQVSFWEQW
jgi:broad specificity phosphatase PhoE